MQSKGTIKFIAVLLVLACLYQLSFTWVTSRVESKAEKFATVIDENGITRIDEQRQIGYLDSMASEKVYPLGLFSYKECKEKELALGLDLKGGMNVTLEISVADMIRALANNNPDPSFQQILSKTEEKYKNSAKDYLDIFQETWREITPNKTMASIFATYDQIQAKRVYTSTSDSDVIAFIREQTESTINNSFNVLRNRIDRFGVVAPNIQRIGNSGRILVELPGIKEPERVRKLLQGTASLEFWETFDCRSVEDGITEYIINADQKIKELQDAEKALMQDTVGTQETITEQTTDSESVESLLAEIDSASNEDDLLNALSADSASVSAEDEQKFREQYPLLSILHINQDVNNKNQRINKACVGRAHYRDTAKINKMLTLPQVLAMKPNNLRFAWGNKPVGQEGVVYELIALKLNPLFGNEAPLTGEVIVDARKEFNQASGNPFPHVSMSMNKQGSTIWAQLTKTNIDKEIAVVLDGYVYSYPNVNQEITGGISQISGNFSIQEADDLVNVLSSGKMPAPARIVQEAVVGPTLGKESISAGMFSFLLAFIFILLYMFIYYNNASFATIAALITNVFLIFGVLAAFGAVLTMPGIAGIVLTLGMAIDANIIINERIKEEYSAGKALRLAITDGYKNAYSAIIDGQLTTLIAGIVLLSYGTGPVRGFATTLIIGIVTSLFTSIFISRLIYEWLLNKGKNIKFGYGWSLKFLKNTKFKFIQMRHKVFGIVAIVLIAGLAIILTRGFSQGVDFTGGRTYVVRFDKNILSNDVRAALLLGIGEGVEVKQFGNSDQMKITTKYKYDEQTEDVDREVEIKLYESLKALFKDSDITFEEFVSTQTNPHGIISSEKVGATIASDITRRAIWAVIISLFLIFGYIAIRFTQWQWGFGGVVALVANSLFTMSIFAFGAGIFPWSMEIDQTFIAAMLTIIGYSINDTVIIFDRIREYRKLYPKRELGDSINDAINATLSRTLNTSLSTIFVLLLIFFFGGDVIRGFAFAMTVGIAFGTFSSIFIATPIAYELIQRKQKAKTKTVKPELLKK